MDLLSQSAALVALTSFAFGVSVLARNTRNTLYLLYFALMAVVSAWAMTFLIARNAVDSFAYESHLILNAWIGTLALLFLRDLLQDGRSSRLLFRLSLLISTLSTVSVLMGLTERWEWLKTIVLVAPGTLIVQILLLWSREGFGGFLERRGNFRRPLIYIGAIFVMSTAVLDHAPVLGPVVPVIGNVGLVLYLYLLAQAITQQTGFHLGFYIARLSLVLVFALILTGLHATFFRLENSEPGTLWLSSFVLAFFFIALIDPLRQMIDFLSQRWSARAYLELNRRLDRLIENVRSLGGLEPVLKESARGLVRLFSARRVDIYCADRSDRWIRRESAQGPASEGDERIPQLRELEDTDPVVAGLRLRRAQGVAPYLLESALAIEQERSVAKAQREEIVVLRQRMRELGADLIIGAYDQDLLVGVIVIDVPFAPVRFGGSWAFLQGVFESLERMAQVWARHLDFDRKRDVARLEELGELSAGLAHEIRNPLGSIKGAIQLIRDKSEMPQEDLKLLEIALSEVDRLNRVVAQFLSYARGPQFTLERIDLVELVRQWVRSESAHPIFQAAPLTVLTELERAEVLAHRDSVQQVLANLAQNAAQSLAQSKESAPQITLIVRQTRRPASVVLSVRDNGAGISTEMQSKLFVPFFSARPGGTGLGLSISQRLAQSMGARIEVSSRLGEFAQFDVIFPQDLGVQTL